MAALTLPSGLPKTIRTVLQPDKLSANLTITQEPLPTPTEADDVLVKVHTTCPCAGELWWARDFPSSVPAGKLPVPCSDLSGTVVAAPADSKFRPGDEVYARVDAGRPGCAREYTLAKVGELALKPKTLNFVETAATPLSALTAWQMLFAQGTLDAAALKGDAAAAARNAKQRVLVTSAAGGVGSWIVQLASLAGAGAVVALCGPGKEGLVRELGATEVVDYSKTTLEAWAKEDPAREVDFVVSCVGGKTLTGAWAAVREGGAIVNVSGGPPDMFKPEGLEKKLAKSIFFIVEPLGSNLEEITELIDAGKVKPVVDSVWELEDINKAFGRLEEGHAKGKIVVKVDGLV